MNRLRVLVLGTRVYNNQSEFNKTLDDLIDSPRPIEIVSERNTGGPATMAFRWATLNEDRGVTFSSFKRPYSLVSLDFPDPYLYSLLESIDLLMLYINVQTEESKKVIGLARAMEIPVKIFMVDGSTREEEVEESIRTLEKLWAEEV